MKKNLRLLCLGLAAATFTAGFAQAQDVTSKLRNADMEEGVKGWGIDGESNIFGKNTKVGRPGFHGVNNMVLENWNGSGAGLGDNSISQTVRELPAGTYVFGAYIGASLQGTEESNKEAVTGVTLFANEAGVSVATDNPDKGHKEKWAHTGKFNVAATVAEGGSLNVGLDVKATTANYVIWDNATLYYFGNMSEAEALNEMAKIDMAATVAIADTCLAHKMNVDSLALLNAGITAGKAIATADQLWQLNEDLYWAINKATKSISDYKSFNNAIVAAEEAAAGDWSTAIKSELAALNTAITAAKATYEAATAGRPELDEQKAALREATALVALDTCYDVLDGLDEYALSLQPSDELGEYSEEMINQLVDLIGDARKAVDNAYAGDETALRTRHIYDSLYNAIQYILDNPNSVDAFPFTVGEANGTVATKVDGRFEFTSKTYNMPFPVTNLRFTFLESYNENGAACLDSGKYPQIALAEFYIYDGDGNQIDLEEANFSTNAQETTEGPMVNICDGDKGSWWHSKWSSSVGTYHYLEISLPEGLDLTSFSFGWVSRYTAQVVPKTVEVSSISSADADLASAISSAKLMHPYTGTEPGYYKEDVSGFYTALAAAEALVGSDASEEEIYNAIGALETEQGKIDEMKINLPVAGKKYRIVNADYRFFENQSIVKALTVVNDTLWWQTASPDSLQQEFTFEAIPNEDGLNLYKMLNVVTNRYVNSGDEGDFHPLLETADTVELIAIGAGQFGLKAHSKGVFHACDHNSGVVGAGWTGDVYGPAGGMFGDYSGIIPYGDASLDGGSAWFIREMAALPCATKSLTDLNFQSEPIHLYEGVNTLTLTADKASAFADLTVYGLLGEVIKSSVNVSGNVATVMLDTAMVETFSFAFANSEGVAEVSVGGSISTLSGLQDAYDAAVAVAPERGTEVMQYANLDAYDAAIAAAEALLASGGTDEQITAAIAALEKAVAELAPNMPDPDKTYFIVSDLPAFEETHGVPMMLYANDEGAVRWMYENVDKQNRYWKFVPDTQVEEGAPAAFYLLNVGTGKYLGAASGQSSPLAMAEEPDATTSYNIVSLEGTTVAIAATTDAAFRLHCAGHGGGSNKSGNIVYWNSGLGTASIWKICETEAYITDIDFTEIEEGADEYVAPAVKGIFDLFGRRIEAPAATGIYIVDGKKRVIKK